MTVSDSAADQQTSSMPASPSPRTAAFFDLDKTIIAKSSTLAFSKPFFAQGLINRR
ncbi:MAG TPA: HAD-IB family hydrolase, partial [Mycobacterium sp.]|nr:HAD-IB family hydrolase [Mycobacterium sp.]